MSGHHEKLIQVASEGRAAVLAAVVAETPPERGRELLAEWFNACDALAPWTEELREQFERCGYVTDNETELALPVTVYRGAWGDDDVRSALSWTTDRDVAEWFCRYLTGPRARFLGIGCEAVSPTVWKGTCTRAYGYLEGRNEKEVIAAEVIDIEAISWASEAPICALNP